MKIRTLSYALALTSLTAAYSFAQTSSSPASTAGQGTSGTNQGTAGTGRGTSGTNQGTAGTGQGTGASQGIGAARGTEAGQGTTGTQRGTAGDRPSATDTDRGVAGADRGTATKSAVSDSLFAAAAASGGLAEVAISEIGLRQATDPDLKAFSQQMVAEHTRMNSELMAIAAQRRITLPRTPDVRAQFCAQSLMGISGPEFDRCYAKAQLLVHMDAYAMFAAEAERGQDPAIKALAAKALPRIKEHLTMIKPIAMKYEKMEKSDLGDNHDGSATSGGTLGTGSRSGSGTSGSGTSSGSSTSGRNPR